MKINENFICIFSGSALIRVGQTEQALGEIEREYIRHAHEGMCGPLDRFLEGEMRNITRERKVENISYIIIRVPIMCIKSNSFYVTWILINSLTCRSFDDSIHTHECNNLAVFIHTILRKMHMRCTRNHIFVQNSNRSRNVHFPF